MREFKNVLVIYSILLVLLVNCEEDLLLNIPTTTFRIPQNAQEGDVIFEEQQIRAGKDLDESINLQIEGSTPSAIAVNNSIIDSNQPVRFILVNKNAFENGISKVKLQALGVISGKMQEAHLTFEMNPNSELPTISTSPTFLLKSDFQEKETAIVKTSSEIPPNSEVKLFGKYSNRIQATFENDNIILETIPCDDSEPCRIVYPFSLILVLQNEDGHAETTVTFDEEKKSALKMDQKVYTTTIEEHTGEQDRLVKISAKGNSSEILYSLRDSSGLFSIHPKEGILLILHPEFLTISSFGDSVNLTAVATDGENSVKAVVMAKISPKIEKDVVFGFEKPEYNITAENTIKTIGNIAAKTQNNAPLIYRITEGRDDLYRIQPNGDIEYLGELLKEDRVDQITVAVQEEAGGLRMASTRVNIQLNGIGSYPVTTTDPEEGLEVISADDEPGVVIGSIQFSDKDKDSKLEYSISATTGLDENGNSVTSENRTEYFDVQTGEDNQAHLIVRNSLKSSNLTSVRVEVTARDANHPKEPVAKVSRVIVVEREKKVESPKGINLVSIPSNISLPADLPVGSFIYKVSTLPADFSSNLTYSIEPDHILDISDNGTITTVKTINEEPASVPFRVTVTDGLATKKVESVLLLKKVQNAHFTESEYTMNIPRNAPVDTVVSLVSAVDSNGIPVENDFSLRGSHSEYFTVDPQGTIKTKVDFKNEVKKMKNLDFLVALTSDLTITAPVHVRLDEIRKETIKLAENQIFATVFDNLPVNSYVAKVEVPDENDVKYTLQSDEKGVTNVFSIDKDGTIRSLDYLAGFQGMHRLSVLVSSVDQAGVRSANATVVVDVLRSNECVPKFKKDENLIFYARENTPKDTMIGKISAETLDSKCELRYSLWDSEQKKSVHQNEILKINEETSEITTMQEFDYEKIKSYLIALHLTAGRHHSTTTNAELRIIDQDDHAIQFDQPSQTVEVSEDSPQSTIIATVRAVEKDDQPVFYHLGSSSPPQFSLHSTTGQVSIEQPLDREQNEDFVIEIGASNKAETPQSEWPTSMKLHVKIKDVNDNGPTFDRSHYDTVVDKDTVVGSKIIELHASDPDSGDRDKKLEYSVVGANFEYRGMSRSVDEIFDIHQTTGIVSTLQPLRDFVGGVFHVQLQVRDAMDSTIGKAGLKVYVHDSSDLLTMELPYKPTVVTPQIVEEFTSQLSNSTQLMTLPKKVVYKSAHGITSQNSVDLQMIFFNKTSSEILPSERVLAISEKIRGMPELRKMRTQTLVKAEAIEPAIQPELLLLALGFVVLLAIILALCGLLMCYHRSKFRQQKRAVENDMAIKEAINFPANRSPALVSFKHYPSPAPEMHRPIPNGDEHIYRSPRLDEKVGSYAIQQATMTVAEHEEKI